MVFPNSEIKMNPKGPVGDIYVLFEEITVYNMDKDGFIGFETAESFVKRIVSRIENPKKKKLLDKIVS